MSPRRVPRSSGFSSALLSAAKGLRSALGRRDRASTRRCRGRPRGHTCETRRHDPRRAQQRTRALPPTPSQGRICSIGPRCARPARPHRRPRGRPTAAAGSEIAPGLLEGPLGVPEIGTAAATASSPCDAKRVPDADCAAADAGQVDERRVDIVGSIAKVTNASRSSANCALVLRLAVPASITRPSGSIRPSVTGPRLARAIRSPGRWSQSDQAT